jgi:hypothetical protein
VSFDYLLFFQPFSFVHSWLLPIILALLAAVPLAAPGMSLRLSSKLDRVLGWIARRRLLSGLLLALPGTVAAIAYYLVTGAPVARVHDEFSYLLAADTFLHGRLANPAHPLWQGFESFHINQTPTYASMYPPGQGLVLAAGSLLFGNPWAGVCLSVVALCMVTSWALRGWLPARWALVGGLIAASMAPLSYWMTSYWGGAVAAVGGALVVGAWPRLRRTPSVSCSLLFALGVVILANTRMYEGAVLVAIAGTDLLWLFFTHPVASRRIYFWRFLVPAGTALLAGSCWTMFYFWRVTGNPFLVPYIANFRIYGYRGLFIWQGHGAAPVYLHEVMRRLYVDSFAVSRLSPAFLDKQLLPTLDQFGGALLWLPVCGFWFLVRGRDKPNKLRGLLVATFAVVLAVSISSWIRPHYLAPAMVGLIGLTLQSLRYMSTVRLGARKVGRFAAQALVILWLVAQWKTGVAQLLLPAEEDWAVRRARMVKTLEETGKRHLILVRYGPEHNPDDEWVYNGADLFDASVLWARDMGPELDRNLILYCRDRSVWLLEPDRGGVLSPY